MVSQIPWRKQLLQLIMPDGLIQREKHKPYLVDVPKAIFSFGDGLDDFFSNFPFAAFGSMLGVK